MFILKKQNLQKIGSTEGLDVSYEGPDGLHHTGNLHLENEHIILRDASVTGEVVARTTDRNSSSCNYLFNMYQVRLAAVDQNPEVNNGVFHM